MDIAQNHFALFGLPAQFALDTAALDSRYRAVQAEVHPDRFAGGSDADRRRSMQWSTHANEAYQTLRSPLKRAKYLLAQQGVDVEVESNTAMPPEFLMAQMEWREQFEEARAARDLAELEALHDRLGDTLAKGYADLARALDRDSDTASAARIVRELMFVDRLGSQVNDVLAELE